MIQLNRLENSPFPKLDRVIRNQRWLAAANGFVTFGMRLGTAGVLASLFIG
jgi:hypothetical protein